MIVIDRLGASQGSALLEPGDRQVRNHYCMGTSFEEEYQLPKLLSQRDITGFLESVTSHVPHRVLIADHHPDICLLLRDLMEFLGLSVKIAHYGSDAIALAQQWHPHLILMDLNIPVIDGLEACRQIRAKPPRTFPAMIALCNGNEYRKTILAAGYDDFVSKPFDFEVLLTKLSHFLKKHTSLLGNSPDYYRNIEEVA